MMKAAALAGQAGYYEYKKDYKKAAELYRDASRVNKSNVDNPDYMLKAAINYLHSGQNDTAKELLNSIKDDYKTSAASRQVDRYLALINA
jgi:TolA-binding protein